MPPLDRDLSATGALVAYPSASSLESSHNAALSIFENAIKSFRDILSTEDSLGFRAFSDPNQ